VGNSAVFNVTSVLSPTTTNEFLFTWSRLKNDNRFEDPAKMQLATYGITGLQNPFGAQPYVPEIVNQFDAQRGSLWYAQDVENIFSYNGFLRFGDNFTKVLNTHAVKAGLIVERQYKEQNFQHQNNIQLNFDPNTQGGTGSNFGNLLVGRPQSAAIGQPSAIGEFVAWNIEAYLQDSWKVNKNLTLEYGLRFGKWTNNAEINDLGAIFDPSRYDQSRGLFLDAELRRANGLAYVALGDVPPGLTDARPLQFMPRVNFAWDLKGNGDTVVRGGGGIFFNREQGNAQYNIINVPPNSYAATLDSGSLQNFQGVGLTYATIGQVDPFNALNGFNLATMSIDQLDWPRMYQTSLSVAQRIPWRSTIELGYIGTFGRDLAAQQQVNSIPEGGLSSGRIGNADLTNPLHRAHLSTSVVNARRPFPTLQEVNLFRPIGNSNYHAVQATLSRQSGSFQYLLAYTWSRLRGTTGNDFAQVDALDLERAYGVLLADRPHNAVFSWTWRLGDPIKEGGILGAVANGWNLSGISTYQSGEPIRVGFTGDLGSDQAARGWFGTHDHRNYTANFGEGGSGDITPLFTCDPRQSGSDVGDKILNIDCFGIPGFGQTGPFQAPYNLRGPSRSFHDLTVFKDFRIGQGDKRVQFRVGVFNLFNQAYPLGGSNEGDISVRLDTTCNRRVNGVPNGAGGFSDNVCDPTGGFSFTQNTIENFGKITNKRGHRVVEFALRLFF
jgi:hypothetical protein